MRLRHRLLLGLLAFSLAATVAADVAGTALFRERVRRLATDRLQVESALLVRRLGAALEDPSTNLQALVTDIAADLHLRLTVMGPRGTVLADSSVPASQVGGMDNHLDRPEIREARETGSGHSSRQSATLGVSMSYFARSLQGPGGRIGFLRLAVPTADLEAGLPAMRLTADLMVLGVLMAGSLIVYLLSLGILRRVQRLARAADRIASGAHDLPTTMFGGGPDLEALGAAMDRMRRALLDRIAELTGQHELRDAVLAGMREGLLVVDTQRQVILANAALGEYLDLHGTPPAGRHLAEVIRDPLVFDAYKRTLEEREECRTRVELSFPAERIFDLLVEPLDTPEGEPLGAIGIFLDTTRTQVLERVRRTFVSDLSHEMRTPLASIAAAVETLQEAGPLSAEENANLLAILTRNVARLRALLEDLTDLSKIETGAITLDLESVVLAEMIGDVFVSLGALAEAAGVRLLSEVPRDLRIRADRRRLDQILMNVVENAIKFNKPGGTVKVFAGLEEERILIRVDDTGEGIPPAERDLIFRRFHRVDRSRSRQAGGRGLGLAIVKHLVRLHGGTIRAEPREEGGTSMRLEFPVTGPAQSVREEAV